MSADAPVILDGGYDEMGWVVKWPSGGWSWIGITVWYRGEHQA